MFVCLCLCPHQHDALLLGFIAHPPPSPACLLALFFSAPSLPAHTWHQINQHLVLNADGQQLPLISFEDFWLLRDKLVPMNNTVEEVTLQLLVKPQKLWWWQIQQQVRLGYGCMFGALAAVLVPEGCLQHSFKEATSCDTLHLGLAPSGARVPQGRVNGRSACPADNGPTAGHVRHHWWLFTSCASFSLNPCLNR